MEYGEIVTDNEYEHQIDSSACIECPNDDCHVGRVSLDDNLRENGLIKCEWCDEKFGLKVIKGDSM